MDGVSFEGASQKTKHWQGYLRVGLPDGVRRHPRLIDQVEEAVTRIIAIDTGFDGVSIGFGLHGETYDQAREDANVVIEQVLGCVGLSDSSIEELRVYERPLPEHTDASDVGSTVVDLESYRNQ